MYSVTNNFYCARLFGKCCEVRGIIADTSLAEPGTKPQDFILFSHPVLPPAVFAFGIFHPWLFLNENQWVKIPKVIFCTQTRFFPFYIVHKIEPSEWADVAYSLHCSGPFPSLSSLIFCHFAW